MPTTVSATTRCSFCTKEEEQVSQMVAGPGVYICNECVSLCNAIFAEGRNGNGDSTLPYWESMTDEELLARLPRIASVATQVEDNLRVWVQRLRDRGVSWARIGSALTMTRQSAWERFANED
jgi:hypothetical protein